MARVHLPDGAEAKIIFVDAFTGTVGAQGKDFVIFRDGGNRPMFETQKTLHPGEGLTIKVGWPKGFVTATTRQQELSFFVRDNRGLIIGGIGLMISTLYYLIVWSRVGKDPEKGTIIPIYGPSPRYSPASIRYISQMGYDDKVFAAAVISLAVKGAILIREQPIGNFTLTRINPHAHDLKEDERSLLKKLFIKGDTISLERTNREIIKGAVEELKKRLSSAYERIYFYTNKGYFFVGAAISVCAAALSAFYGGTHPLRYFCLYGLQSGASV